MFHSTDFTKFHWFRFFENFQISRSQDTISTFIAMPMGTLPALLFFFFFFFGYCMLNWRNFIILIIDFFFLILNNRLCVIGLARTHVAFKDTSGITAVDFNVGKSDRSGIKVTGKRKKVLKQCIHYLNKLLYYYYHLNSC